MRFPVVWDDDALAELASIWLDAADREYVNMAARTIDRLLMGDPQQKGSEASEQLRYRDVYLCGPSSLSGRATE